MISVLIPVFNRNVTALVTTLHHQLTATNIRGEIIVMDDASPDTLLKNENRAFLSALAHVHYLELPHNAGRNIIRHKLAAAAAYDTLIFLDADSSFPDFLWLQRYAEAVHSNSVIMGGRAYQTGISGAASLHFHYGQLREQHSPAQRNKFPYRSFLACNFLISKQQLSRLIIDNHLKGYCHEDTFMGLQFEKLGIPVLHIDNPVYHNGIDEDGLFIKKQREALENLFYLYQAYHTQYHFITGIKLIRVHQQMAATRTGRLMLAKMAAMEKWFHTRTLQSRRLFWLDCWKLAVYHKLSADAHLQKPTVL